MCETGLPASKDVIDRYKKRNHDSRMKSEVATLKQVPDITHNSENKHDDGLADPGSDLSLETYLHVRGQKPHSSW